MNKVLLFLSLFGLLASPRLAAQSEPRERAVARLHPGMVWRVEELPPTARILAGDPDATRETPGRLVERGSVGRDHRRRETPGPQGQWIDQYITREFLLTRQPDGSFTLESTDEIEESRLPRLRPDRLREFAWVEGLQPLARKNIDGVDCELFAVRFDGTPAEPTSSPDQIRFVAAIGLADRFPRRLETPERILRFIPQPNTAPTALPSGAQSALDAYAESLRKKVQQYALPR